MNFKEAKTGMPAESQCVDVKHGHVFVAACSSHKKEFKKLQLFFTYVPTTLLID